MVALTPNGDIIGCSSAPLGTWRKTDRGDFEAAPAEGRKDLPVLTDHTKRGLDAQVLRIWGAA